jgi:hypothetical protein
MSLLGKIKKGVENSGSSMGKIVYTKDGSKIRIRFLQDVEDGIEVRLHDHYDRGINALCQTILDEKCPYCESEEEGWRHRDGYVWSVYDHDAKEVKLFVGFANNFSPLPSLIGMAEAYGNWVDRDYVISQTGKQLSKQLAVVPMDKAKFKNPKAKPYSKKKLIDILSKAYPINESDAVGNKNGKKKPKKQVEIEEEDEDEDEETEGYENMSPRDLYMECIERGITAKKKQKAKYYIELLEEDDEKNKDSEEEDWEEDEEDEDGDDW